MAKRCAENDLSIKETDQVAAESRHVARGRLGAVVRFRRGRKFIVLVVGGRAAS